MGPTIDVELHAGQGDVAMVVLDSFMDGSRVVRIAMPITGPAAYRTVVRYVSAVDSSARVGAVVTIAVGDLHLGFWQTWLRDRRGPWPHGNPLAAIDELLDARAQARAA